MFAYSEVIGGGALLTIGIGGFSILWKRISDKQDAKMCEVLHKEIKENMEKGDKRFKAIEDELKEQGRSLAGINTSLALIALKLEDNKNAPFIKTE